MVYRKEGLRLDDLIPEENELVQEALRRLDPKEQAERLFRFRRALNVNMKKNYLPEQEWTTTSQDQSYLGPILTQLEGELETRHNYNNLVTVPAALLSRNKSS
jgi:ubiquinol-cytochrome c reductase subunit 7